MFEQEIEMEKRESSVVPLLLIVAMILAIVGLAGYYVWQNQQVMSTADAGNVVSASLKAQGPAVVRFHTGMVKASVNEKPEDPHYRLLEKAGLLKRGKLSGRTYPIVLTSQGEKLLAEIPDVQKTRERDNTDLYVVPLAERRLAEISKITMLNPERAQVFLKGFAKRYRANGPYHLLHALALAQEGRSGAARSASRSGVATIAWCWRPSPSTSAVPRDSRG